MVRIGHAAVTGLLLLLSPPALRPAAGQQPAAPVVPAACAHVVAGDAVRWQSEHGGASPNFRGELVRLDDRTLVVQALGQAQQRSPAELPGLQVHCRLNGPGRSHALPGLLIGAGIGGIGGALFTQAFIEGDGSTAEAGEVIEGGLLGMVAGGLLGGALGLAVRSTRDWVPWTPATGPTARLLVVPGNGPGEPWRAGVSIPVGH